MKSKMIKFSIWLLLVCAWNFGVPEAEPIYDVSMAVLLSFVTKINTKRKS